MKLKVLAVLFIFETSSALALDVSCYNPATTAHILFKSASSPNPSAQYYQMNPSLLHILNQQGVKTINRGAGFGSITNGTFYFRSFNGEFHFSAKNNGYSLEMVRYGQPGSNAVYKANFYFNARECQIFP